MTGVSKMYLIYGLVVALLHLMSIPQVTGQREIHELCPDIDEHIYDGVPSMEKEAGRYESVDDARVVETCVQACCVDLSCNVAFQADERCFKITCHNYSSCEPKIQTANTTHRVQMVWVHPLPDDEAPVKEPSGQASHTCIVGVKECQGEHEICRSRNTRARFGYCLCKQGYSRNSNGICAYIPDAESLRQVVSTPQPPQPSHLVVSVVSKTIQLPENEATLSAFPVPAESPNGEKYSYIWKLISHPADDESATVQDQNAATLKLSSLIEGTYAFMVNVTGGNASGVAYANVTVQPPKRINRPPVASINPSHQVVHLPNNEAILDGSSSTDDEKIATYKWELQQGPIGYQAKLEPQPTLLLKDLVAGNYTFKLTVEDSDGASNSTTANVTVTKETDYPPTANAGSDVIVYLPQTTLTLNGNISSDDKAIDTWEWTLTSPTSDKAVDMQNTHSPYLQLSNLELGVYTFSLKVTDTAGQSSTAEVRVFVKEPPNKPPKADAGKDLAITLPLNWVTLDGSASSDEVGITKWTWTQIRGPNDGTFLKNDKAKVNVTGLTRGEYEFLLIIADANGNTDNDTVLVTVTQSENRPPKANAGGDQTIVLPTTLVVLNGSRSEDDVRIEKWEWIRDGSSLAAGKVLGKSDNSPLLQLTNVVPGRYVFRLKVYDEQGLSSEDSVSIIVKPSAHVLDIVEVVLNVALETLTEAEKSTVIQQLALLLHEDSEVIIHLLEIKEEPHSGHVVLQFYAETDKSSVIRGPTVTSRLRSRLRHDESLLQYTALSVDTLVCQNNCSGHGACELTTRECMCEAFWMENPIRRKWGDGERNCDWSVLYVVVVIFVVILTCVGLVWIVTYTLHRFCCEKRSAAKLLSTKHSKIPATKHRYSLLGNEDGLEMSTKALNSVVSDSDESDSDVLFDGLSAEINKTKKNGFLKSSRSRRSLRT